MGWNLIPFGDIARSATSVEDAVTGVGDVMGAGADAVEQTGWLSRAIAGFSKWWDGGKTEANVASAQRHRSAIYERGAVMADATDAANVNAVLAQHPELGALAQMGEIGTQAIEDAVQGGPNFWQKHMPGFLGGWSSDRLEAYDYAVSIMKPAGSVQGGVPGQMPGGGAQMQQQGLAPAPLGYRSTSSVASPANNAAALASWINGEASPASAPTHPTGQLQPPSTPATQVTRGPGVISF
ncbi:MAG: hypothetical protein U1E36_07740 [Rickettsiales bacterium]